MFLTAFLFFYSCHFYSLGTIISIIRQILKVSLEEIKQLKVSNNLAVPVNCVRCSPICNILKTLSCSKV